MQNKKWVFQVWVPIGMLRIFIQKKIGVIEYPVMAMGSKVGIWGKVPYPRGYQIRQLPVYSTIVQYHGTLLHTTTIRAKTVSGFPSIGFQNGLEPVRGEIDDTPLRRQKQNTNEIWVDEPKLWFPDSSTVSLYFRP